LSLWSLQSLMSLRVFPSSVRLPGLPARAIGQGRLRGELSPLPLRVSPRDGSPITLAIRSAARAALLLAGVEADRAGVLAFRVARRAGGHAGVVPRIARAATGDRRRLPRLGGGQSAEQEGEESELGNLPLEHERHRSFLKEIAVHPERCVRRSRRDLRSRCLPELHQGEGFPRGLSADLERRSPLSPARRTPIKGGAAGRFGRTRGTPGRAGGPRERRSQ
jgi:hypothetical protein